MSRPLILLSNDDGYQAGGIRALGVALRVFADVVLCAPETEQSTTSHSLTLTRPLRLRPLGDAAFAVDGTPADCVYVALNAGTRVLPRRPDLVVSGMNHGLNLGTDVFYSGTVAAAREGALRGIPAMAASADPGANPEKAAAVCAEIARALLFVAPVEPLRPASSAPTSLAPLTRRVPSTLINVNVPAGSEWKVVSTRLGLRLYQDLVEFRVDPRGREYFWLGGGGVRHEPLSGSDTEAHDASMVSVTPLLLDLTSAEGGALVERVVAAASASTGTTADDSNLAKK